MNGQSNGYSAASSYTKLGELPDLIARLHKSYYSGKTKDVRWRKDQLKHLAYLIKDNIQDISEAIRTDLGRSHNETYILELSGALNEVLVGVDQVEKWAKPERPNVPLDKRLLKPTIYKEPKGVALIVGTWNYPVILSLVPLIGAISAGCPAILKLSEVVPATSSILAKLIPKYLDQDAYTVVLGEVDVATALLKEKWGHVFYTGNAKTARIVATAAAQTLSPVTLELGGKSPCMIDPELSNLQTAVKRILWGKRSNCGQTCIAPDFVIVPQNKHDELVAALQAEVQRIMPSEERIRKDYARIVSHAHFDRLQGALAKTEGKIVCKGIQDREDKIMGLTIVDDVTWNDGLMQSEIFGPILPIVTVPAIDEALHHLQQETPLAIYVFSDSNKFIGKIRTNTRSGGFVVNDVMLQHVLDDLPFGGTGESGQGNYHGKKSFDTFTHERASLTVPFWADLLLSVRYYPHTDTRTKWFHRTQVRKIGFARPPTSIANGASRQGTAFTLLTKLLKYALMVSALAFAVSRYSWIVSLIPRFKLVKV